MRWILMLYMVLLLAPIGLSAGTFGEKDMDHEKKWTSFNNVVEKKTKEIKALVFGPITKILGMLGIAYGVFSMLATASPRPLIMYGGIGLLLNIIPYFIDTVFSATLTGL
jgi:hypothetical protein